MTDAQPAGITGVAALDSEIPLWRRTGTAGFIFAYNITFRGPEFFYTEYPRAWQIEYEAGSYACFDPVFHWLLLNVGDCRWSDIAPGDPKGIFASARRHGLHYGAAFGRSARNCKCFITLARDDREFTDAEMAALSASADAAVAGFHRDRKAGLSTVEQQTLRCLRDGLSYGEVSAALKVSERAIKARVESARGKLGARNATQAVAIAIQRHLI